jgi:hypothetical protein
MLKQEQLDQIKLELSSSKINQSRDKFLDIVNIFAFRLEAKYVEIFTVDTTESLAVRRAGSGEIGKIFNHHPSIYKLIEHDDPYSQVGSVIVSGKPRVVNWETNEPEPSFIKQPETNLVVISGKYQYFHSPDVVSQQDIYLPIQFNNLNIGALVIYFDDFRISIDKEVFLLQSLANFVGKCVN